MLSGRTGPVEYKADKGPRAGLSDVARQDEAVSRGLHDVRRPVRKAKRKDRGMTSTTSQA